MPFFPLIPIFVIIATTIAIYTQSWKDISLAVAFVSFP